MFWLPLPAPPDPSPNSQMRTNSLSSVIRAFALRIPFAIPIFANRPTQLLSATRFANSFEYSFVRHSTPLGKFVLCTLFFFFGFLTRLHEFGCIYTDAYRNSWKEALSEDFIFYVRGGNYG